MVRGMHPTLSERGQGGGWPRSAPTGPCGPRAHSGHRSSATGRRRVGLRATAHRCASPRACPLVGAAGPHWDAPGAGWRAEGAPRSATRRSRSARRRRARRQWGSALASRDRVVPAPGDASGAPDGRDEPALGAGAATATSGRGARVRRRGAKPRGAADAAPRARSGGSALLG
jgi:hypothetical protein